MQHWVTHASWGVLNLFSKKCHPGCKHSQFTAQQCTNCVFENIRGEKLARQQQNLFCLVWQFAAFKMCDITDVNVHIWTSDVPIYVFWWTKYSMQTWCPFSPGRTGYTAHWSCAVVFLPLSPPVSSHLAQRLNMVMTSQIFKLTLLSSSLSNTKPPKINPNSASGHWEKSQARLSGNALSMFMYYSHHIKPAPY